MRRQFDGLTREQQYAFAHEYEKRFGARIRASGLIGYPVEIDNVPALCTLAPEDRAALEELDRRVFEAFMASR